MVSVGALLELCFTPSNVGDDLAFKISKGLSRDILDMIGLYISTEEV